MNQSNVNNPDYLFMIEQAIKAPSGHNTQPWRFSINETGIEIHPDYERSLPVVDFDNRELFISLGCATENLCIAASHRGYESQISIQENGTISINLIKSPTVTPDPLFNQIAERQTNRSVYNGNSISSESLHNLEKTPSESGMKFHLYKNGTPEFDTIGKYVVEGNRIQMQDQSFLEELLSWMRFNKKHQDETNDGLSYAVFNAPNLPLFIIKPIMTRAVNEKSQNKGDRKKIQSSSHFVLFTTSSNTTREWVRLGITLERFLLQSTELGIIHAYMNQPNEIPDLATKMAEALKIPNEYPTVLLRMGYGKKMPYSKRRRISLD